MSALALDLRDASLGFYQVWIAAVGSRNGLFVEIGGLERTPRAIAARLGLEPRAVERWCRAAQAVGLVERRGTAYRIAPRHAKRLARDDPETLARQFEYLAAKSAAFDRLDGMLRGRWERPDHADVYALATGWDHLAFFDLVLPGERATLDLLRRGADVLDLGAGDGAWAREAADRFPKSRFVAAETRAALPRLRKGLSRTRIPALDAAKLPLRAFDVVYLGEVLGASGDPAVPLRAAHRALRPGGRLHALEGLLPPADRTPRGWGERLIVAMAFDFGLDGSRFLARDEALDAVRRAGFVRASARDVGGSLFHLRARKRSVQA